MDTDMLFKINEDTINDFKQRYGIDHKRYTYNNYQMIINEINDFKDRIEPYDDFLIQECFLLQTFSTNKILNDIDYRLGFLNSVMNGSVFKFSQGTIIKGPKRIALSEEEYLILFKHLMNQEYNVLGKVIIDNEKLGYYGANSTNYVSDEEIKEIIDFVKKKDIEQIKTVLLNGNYQSIELQEESIKADVEYHEKKIDRFWIEFNFQLSTKDFINVDPEKDILFGSQDLSSIHNARFLKQ